MADPTITALAVRDAGGTTQNTATVVQGGNEFPAHVGYGWDGSTTLHPALVDSAGRQIVSGAAAAGSAVTGNPLLVGGSDGTNAQSLATDTHGVLKAPYTRLLQLSSTFTPSASYSTGNCFGGLFTFDASGTLGAAAQEVRISFAVMALLAASFGTPPAMTSFWFNANPSASTFTDASGAVLNTADKGKLQYSLAASALTAGLLGTGAQIYQMAGPATGQPVMTDAAGKLYMALTCGAGFTLTTPAVSEMFLSLLY